MQTEFGQFNLRGNIFLWEKANMLGTRTKNLELLITWEREAFRSTAALHSVH